MPKKPILYIVALFLTLPSGCATVAVGTDLPPGRYDLRPYTAGDRIQSAGGEKLTFTGPVLFEFGSYKITDESALFLSETADMLLAHPEIEAVTIEGYACAIGPDAVNMELSQRRAEAVKRYLEQRGVDPGRVEIEWHGATGQFPGGYKTNRRVSFAIQGLLSAPVEWVHVRGKKATSY